jgi:dTMP kinase
MFFSFDGIDGVGKGTQLALLEEHLRAAGHKVLTCRDPGTTQAGEHIRDLLLGKQSGPISTRTAMFLFMAARAQLVEQCIAPALAAGQIVISDRFLLANVVYQGYGSGLDVDTLWEVGRLATGGLEPDLTFLLDMDVAAARVRLGEDLDRFEQRGHEEAQRRRDGFLSEAQRRGEQIQVIAADRPIEEIQGEIRRLADERLAAAAVRPA